MFGLTKDIIYIIKKYTSYKVYIVLRKYTENSCDIYTNLFGTYSSYNRAYTEVYSEIDKQFKKYNKFPFESKDTYKIDYYASRNGKNFYDNSLENYVGSITYTTICTKRETIGVFENTRYLQYIYNIQEHYLNVKSPEEMSLL